MARRSIEARTARVNGSPVVVLSPDDFELLDASRRQVGARQAQVSRLSSDLRATREQLAEAVQRARDAVDHLSAQPCRFMDRDRCARCEALEALIPLVELSVGPERASAARSA